MQFLLPYVKVLAPNLLMGSSRMSETLPHPGSPVPCTYVAGLQEKFENGDAIVLRHLLGQGFCGMLLRTLINPTWEKMVSRKSHGGGTA